jgi:hypothetical protein
MPILRRIEGDVVNMQSIFTLEASGKKSLKNLVNDLKKFAGPLRDMWPWFRVKLALVADSGTWVCLYLGVTGQFEEPQEDDVHTSASLITATLRFPAVDLWTLLTKFELHGKAQIMDWQVEVPGEYTFVSDVWTRAAGPYGLRDIRVMTDWSALCFEARTGWASDVKVDVEGLIHESLREDLNWVDGAEKFLERQLGLSNFRFREAKFEVQLPLGFMVERDTELSSAGGLNLKVHGAKCLVPEEIRLAYSPDFKYRDNMRELRLPVEVSETDSSIRWTRKVTLPTAGGLVQIRHPLVGRPLPHEYSPDSMPKQLEFLIGHIYDFRDQSRGYRRWVQALKNGDGSKFEVALHNAVARFGWPAFFTGAKDEQAERKKGGDPEQANTADPVGEDAVERGPAKADDSFTTAGDQPPTAKGTQPQTEGFDLVVFDLKRMRILLISAKGSERLPGTHEAAKLNDQVTKVARMFEGWTVSGRLVCNKISASRLESLPKMEAVEYSGVEWVEQLLACSDRIAAEYLIWPTEPLRDAYGLPLVF